MASSSRPSRSRRDKSYAESPVEEVLEGDDDDDFVDDEEVPRRSSRKRNRRSFRRSSSHDEDIEPPAAPPRTRSGRLVRKPADHFSPSSTPPDNKKSFSQRLSSRKARKSAAHSTNSITPPPPQQQQLQQRNLRSSLRRNSDDNDVLAALDGNDFDSEGSYHDVDQYRKRAKKEPRTNDHPDPDHPAAAAVSPKQKVPLRVRLRIQKPPNGDGTAARNGVLPNGKAGEAAARDADGDELMDPAGAAKGSLSPNADSGESEVPIRRTRASTKKQEALIEEERLDGNDEDFQIPSEADADDDDEFDAEEEEEEAVETNRDSSANEWDGEGMLTRNRRKRASNRVSPPAKRTRRETRAASTRPTRPSRRPTADYISTRKSRPSRSVRPRTKRRAASRAAERNTDALDTYRPSRNTMRARDFYEQTSSGDDHSDSSDDDEFLGSARAGKSVISPRPPAPGAPGGGTDGAAGAAPDYLSNPMALLDDYGGRTRPGRYARRRNRGQPPKLDGFGIDQHGKVRGAKQGAKNVGIEPIQVDLSLTWDGIGGLDHHIRALKEMVFLPLMYPEVFDKFKMEPPKGVLFYGPPGTGKTLCARTLAASCGGEVVPEETPPSADAAHSAAQAALQSKAAPAPAGTGTAPAATAPAAASAPTEGADAAVAAASAPKDAGSCAPVVPDAFIVGPAENEAALPGAGPGGVSVQLSGDTSGAAAEAVQNSTVLQQAAGLLAGASAEQLANSVGAAPSAPATGAPVATGAQPGATAADAAASGAAKKTRRPRVAFFMRNGADCLSKWVGEAERQLRMTFEAAKKHQPAIIFFDEIDGLAPVRSSRQDQIHSSIVSTLLGLMDGLDSRGKIVVIGATNRVDAIDPALRRPGRFDRELIFTLPNGKARRRILDIQTAKWKPSPPPAKVLDAVAARTVGYCGADLRALCSEATLRALRRRYPQIYESQEKLLIDVDSVRVSTRDFLAAMNDIVPASHRSARTHARPIPPRLAAVLSEPLQECSALIRRIFPQGIAPGAKNVPGNGGNLLEAVPNGPGAADREMLDVEDLSEEDFSDGEMSEFNEREFDNALGNKIRAVYGKSSASLRERPVLRPRLLLCGRPGLGQAQLGPALLHYLEGCPVHAIDMPSLHINSSARSPEEALVTAVREACRAAPSVLYLPHLHLWWKTAHESLRTTLIITLRDIPADLPLLFLATAEEDFDSLPAELTELFAEYVRLLPSKREHRVNMFAPLIEEAVTCPKITDAMLRKKRLKRRNEVLPKAPPPPPKVVTPEESARTRQEDDRYIRDLRIEMRNFVERLLRERKFKAFWLPVDPTIAPDYYNIVQNPMDISKIAAQVDKGMYPTVLSMVRDFDLMVKNAIDYNPAHTEEGAAILRRAHGLVDIVHAWVDNLNPVLVERCNRIVAARIASATAQKEKEAREVAQKEATTKALAQKSAEQGPQPMDTAPATNPDAMDVEEQQPNQRSTSPPPAAAAPVPQGIPGGSDPARARAQPRSRDATPDTGKRSRRLSPVDPPTVPRGDTPNGRAGAEREDGPAGEPAVPEPPFKAADEAKVAQLRRLFYDVTTGISVDGLEGLHVRCATLLHRFRRSRDRAAVVDALTNLVTEAREDPAVVGQLVE